MLFRLTRVALIGIASVVLISPATVQAQTTPAYGPSSLARIRASLAEQPRLQAPPPSTDVVPMFRVDVTQHFSLEDPADEPPFDPTWGLPSAGQLMMGGIGKLGSAISGYKKRRAKGRARKEVSDALAEFCAVQACPPPAGK